MEKQFNAKADDLYRRIQKRLNESFMESDSENITVYDLKRYTVEAMQGYNNRLLVQPRQTIEAFNKKLVWSNLLMRRLPYISGCIPEIDNEGKITITVMFTDYEGTYKGKAIINEDGTFEIVRLNDYTKGKAIKVLESLKPLFNDMLVILYNFREEYKGYSHKWSEYYHFGPGVQEFQDDLFHCSINLSHPEDAHLGLRDGNDIEVANTKSKKYGTLYDYIDFYNEDFMKKVTIRIEDLKPLFKEIVKKNYKLENGETRKLD